MKNNKKGFTLIELLAVIVILAILVMLAIPAVTRYLTEARQKTYVQNATEAIKAVQLDVTNKGFSNQAGGTFVAGGTDGAKMLYTKDQINALLEKKLNTSPFGPAYSNDIYIEVVPTSDGNGWDYYICLTDTAKNGIERTKEGDLKAENVKINTATECTKPTGYSG